MQKQTVELVGNGKDHMKIRHRQQVPLPGLDPGLPLRILAFGTMTVTATVITDTDMSTGFTGIYMATQG
jgi:hypothetical protein